MKVKELKFNYRGKLIRIPVKDIWGYSIRDVLDQVVEKSQVVKVPGLSYLTLRLDGVGCRKDIEVCCSYQTCYEPTLKFLNNMREEYENSIRVNCG